jgi:hypothetical protein
MTEFRGAGTATLDAPAWVSENEEVAEEIRRFKYEFGPLIEQAVTVQRLLRMDPQVQRLMAASPDATRTGSDGSLNPEALELGVRLIQIPALTALANSAGSLGCKGMGILTANAEAALIIGAQAGAELVWLWPYKIGTFKTPNRIVGRAWYEATIGLDLGISGTIAPFPLDLSFWFLPPENSNHMVGVYLGVVAGTGFRVELFGWVPEKPEDRLGGLIDVNPFNFIYGFRVIVEVGYHVGLGVAFKGHQVAATGGLDLTTFYVSPSNIKAAVKYDGTAYPLIEGVVTPPQRDDQPSKTFRSGATPSTLQLSFPNWLCSGMQTPPSIMFKNDGGGGTKGWSLTNSPDISSLTYAYQWAGTDNQAWQSNIDFTISTYSTSTPPLEGAASCKLNGLANVGPVDVPVSLSACKMTLSAQVFSASGNYTLTVDPSTNVIEDFSGNTATANLQASTADAADQNHFYYIPNPNDSGMKLIIDYTGTNKQYAGTSWYAGYQYQQQDGNSFAMFRPVFWQVGKQFFDKYLECGDWEWLEDTSQKYTSSVTWSGGTVTKSTILTITLTPNPVS